MKKDDEKAKYIDPLTKTRESH